VKKHEALKKCCWNEMVKTVHQCSVTKQFKLNWQSSWHGHL